MNTKNKSAGYTIVELLTVLAFLAAIALGCGLLCVAWHFISKFW